jgi:hypothetical protein
VGRSIRVEVSDGVYAALAARAAQTGLSVPELVIHQVTNWVVRPTRSEWPEVGGENSSEIPTQEVAAALGQVRGESARRLAALGGSDRGATAARRRRGGRRHTP